MSVAVAIKDPARITGAFRVEEVPGGSRGGRALVRLLEPLMWRLGAATSPEAIVVPAGFVTDFASIPRALWSIFPPLGPWARPAIVHDFLYATKGTCRWEGVTRLEGRLEPLTRGEADDVFREAMAALEPPVPAWRRAVMWAAVRAGGWMGWGK